MTRGRPTVAPMLIHAQILFWRLARNRRRLFYARDMKRLYTLRRLSLNDPYRRGRWK